MSWWKKKSLQPPAPAETCALKGHTATEHKEVFVNEDSVGTPTRYLAFRCTDCGAEKAYRRSDWNAPPGADTEMDSWKLGEAQRAKREEDRLAKEALDKAFRPKPETAPTSPASHAHTVTIPVTVSPHAHGSGGAGGSWGPAWSQTPFDPAAIEAMMKTFNPDPKAEPEKPKVETPEEVITNWMKKHA